MLTPVLEQAGVAWLVLNQPVLTVPADAAGVEAGPREAAGVVGAGIGQTG